jgi:hypothetical protein
MADVMCFVKFCGDGVDLRQTWNYEQVTFGGQVFDTSNVGYCMLSQNRIDAAQAS